MTCYSFPLSLFASLAFSLSLYVHIHVWFVHGIYYDVLFCPFFSFFLSLSQYIHTCLMCVQEVSWHMPPSWHDSWRDSFINVRWLTHMFVMIHVYMCGKKVTVTVPWRVPTISHITLVIPQSYDSTHHYVWHVSFLPIRHSIACVTSLICICDV